jgi:UDP-perosamine 4-acetyltransferase
MKLTELILMGGGSHARVLIDGLTLLRTTPTGIIDPNLKIGSEILGVPVIDPKALLQKPLRQVSLVNGLGGAHSCGPRNDLFSFYLSKGYRFQGLQHPRALVSQHSQIHESAQVMAGVVIQTNARIFQNCLINTSAVIEHDCHLEAGSFVGPGAVLCGNVKVSAGAFVGAGAVVLPGLKICAGATVGAGSVVTQDVNEPITVVGIPARRIH